MTQFTPSSDITSDDRLMALLSYLLAPIGGIVMLLWEDKKNRPFIKPNAIQGIALGVVEGVLVSLLALIPIVGCFGPLVYIYNIILGLKANKGETVTIPVITDFCKKQGWIA